MLVLVLSYFVIVPQMPVCFLRRNRMGVDLDGRGDGKAVERTEKGENAITICLMRKWFSIKEKLSVKFT